MIALSDKGMHQSEYYRCRDHLYDHAIVYRVFQEHCSSTNMIGVSLDSNIFLSRIADRFMSRSNISSRILQIELMPNPTTLECLQRKLLYMFNARKITISLFYSFNPFDFLFDSISSIK
jgi:hypothetical protein